MEQKFSEPKPHFLILDGLRGVAALMVVAFHIFEIYSNGNHTKQIINHGYLAVDFFFLLSGFVIGYAYDGRWKKMSIREFFKIRLIRLQPMVIMGTIIGAIFFYSTASPALFPRIHDVKLWQLILVMLLGFTLLPLPVPYDIRGWQEMHPLDGPAWSLFFEYIANILYAVWIRKFSKTWLSVLVFIAGVALVQYAVTSPKGDVIGGWSLDGPQMRIGFTRLMYPFFAGLLLFRVGKLIHVKNAFLLCSAMLVIVLSIPRIGGEQHLWANGLYDSLSIIFLFPLIVFIGASGEIKGQALNRIAKFLGDISYPIYITHYPLIYLYSGWVVDNKVPMSKAAPVCMLVFFLSIAIAYACLKIYDEPVRKWLKTKFM